MGDGNHSLATAKAVWDEYARTDTTVRFIVEDVGPGMPEDPDHLIFVPFAKIDDLSEGLGLGLPLCKRHAVSLGGDILLDQLYRDGCRIIFELPLDNQRG